MISTERFNRKIEVYIYIYISLAFTSIFVNFNSIERVLLDIYQNCTDAYVISIDIYYSNNGAKKDTLIGNKREEKGRRGRFRFNVKKIKKDNNIIRNVCMLILIFVI